jgi:hypothetical protein
VLRRADHCRERFLVNTETDAGIAFEDIHMRTKEQLQHLLAVIKQGPGRPADLLDAVAHAEDNRLPLPQLTWALLALVVYVDRLRWAWETIHQRLPGLVRRALEAKGKFYDGTVPDLPDWRYEVGWFRADLSHKGTGERLALNLDKSHRFIMEEEFGTYLLENREPGPAQQRLGELFPRWDVFRILGALVQSGAVRKVPAGLVVPRTITRHAPAVADFLAGWSDPGKRVSLAVSAGDWLAAHDAALVLGDRELAAVLAPQVERCRRRWLNRLLGEVARRGINAVGIDTLAHAGVEDLPRYLHLALRDPGEAVSAVKLVEDDPSWCPTVYGLLLGGRENWKYGWDDVVRACANYLGRHQYQIDRVLALLLADPEPPLGLLIPLALEHRQDLLLALLRQGLCSDSNDHRRTSAAVLALFDVGWSRRELAARLEESDDWEKTLECRLALADSHDPGMRQLAEDWEAGRPYRSSSFASEGANGPDEEVDPTSRASRARVCNEFFRERMNELVDLVMRHRAFSPDADQTG